MLHNDAVHGALQAMLRHDASIPSPHRVTVGLLGRGITESLSPIMHEEEGRRLGLSYAYHLVDFDQLGLADAQLLEVLDAARRLGFAGCNVTYPFKQSVLPLLDGLSPEAAGIGAVNTVVFANGRSTGHNTDCWGFAESFRLGLGAAPMARVLQIGSGGAGAAVAVALLQLGVGALDIFDTEPERARQLAERLRGRFAADVNAVDDPSAAVSSASGVVNATPVGMDKYPGTPIDPALLDERQWVADVVYFPRETALIQQARARGCRVLPGGGMAVYQAVRAFELFSGVRPDGAAMTATFRRAAGV